MKETTERILSRSWSSDLQELEEEMAKDHWRSVSTRSVTIVTFEREIPEPECTTGSLIGEIVDDKEGVDRDSPFPHSPEKPGKIWRDP